MTSRFERSAVVELVTIQRQKYCHSDHSKTYDQNEFNDVSARSFLAACCIWH
jgi:hypothetical protein